MLDTAKRKAICADDSGAGVRRKTGRNIPAQGDVRQHPFRIADRRRSRLGFARPSSKRISLQLSPRHRSMIAKGADLIRCSANAWAVKRVTPRSRRQDAHGRHAFGSLAHRTVGGTVPTATGAAVVGENSRLKEVVIKFFRRRRGQSGRGCTRRVNLAACGSCRSFTSARTISTR